MFDGLKIGTLIVAEGVSLPTSTAKTQPFCAGWRIIENIEARGMDKRFSEMGWSCFEKACPATVNVAGLGDGATLVKAFHKLVRRNKTVKFNCLEITVAVHKTIMGICFVHLSARARNIKQRLW